MKSGILSIGNELIEGYTLDTNAQFFASNLNSIGIDVNKHLSVIDDGEQIVSAINYLRQDHDLIIISGGLGPTNDDLTKESVAKALGLELEMNQKELANLKGYFEKRGYKYNPINDKQAMYTKLDKILVNNRGTANGFYFEHENIKYCILPGPPVENQPLFFEYLKQFEVNEMHELDLYLMNIGETSSEELILDLYDKYNDVFIGCYMQDFGLNYRIKSSNKQRLDQCFNEMKERFKDFYIDSTNKPIESLVNFLIENKISISFAESCTAGLACSLIGDIPGASAILNESIVTYSNEAKMKYLNVDKTILDEIGAVSKECAIAMAQGLKIQTKSDLNISITGIAGPDGGSVDKPVGLVHFGINYNNKTYHYAEVFRGDRKQVRTRAAKFILLEAFKLLKNMM
ncbi:MAG: nicotinamide-nucleotide amidohydrolase family protein [Erysipelotrichales bacterium]